MTPRSLVRTLVFIAIACVAAPVHPATQLVLRRPGNTAPEVLPPGHGITWAAGPRGQRVSRTIDPSAPLRLLVALDAPPAAVARLHAGDASASSRVADRLRADLAALARPGGAQVTRTFTQVWSGAAVTLAPELLERVRALPYVRGVYPDDSVHALLDGSVPLIRADRVRTELGVDGTGIRIGIVDTGIDYTHPAFGNGFGPGHRVAGGYDFVNDDPDPMDDAGHGTHVAGIAAGNGGGVVGVAPGATLYAFKVLDANGNGVDSWILAGLDRVLDPDGNPATDDAVQIVNLSLGGFGDPNDPLSQAIDHLSDLGVTCCVAAGNSGAYFTIGSPGCARSAITVGASTRSDAIAYFSSRGPVSSTLDLKPDLVAPGEGIVSAARGGGRVALSGTSMATPHVAGVAALLRQLHPTWPAATLKSVLISTARDLGVEPFQQGAGRLDAWSAATTHFAITPTHVSFGRIDGDVPVSMKDQPLLVTNPLTSTLTVTLPAHVIITAGATVDVSPSQFDLGPGAIANVNLRLTVDNSALTAPHDAPYGYSVNLPVIAGADTQHVPVSFHKSSELHVTSPGLIDWLIVHDHTSGGFVYSQSEVPEVIYLPPGSYDVMASFYPRWRLVVHENVTVAERADVAIDPAEATHHITFANVGPDGAPCECDMGSLRLADQNSGWRFLYGGFPIPDLWVGDLSEAYTLEWMREENNLRDHRVAFHGMARGMAGDHQFGNSPADLLHAPIEVPRSPLPMQLVFLEYSSEPLFGGYFGLGFADTHAVASDSAFTFDQWFMPGSETQTLQLGVGLELFGQRDGQIDWRQRVRAGPYLRLDHGWPLPVHYLSFLDPPWLQFSGARITLGGLPVWRGHIHASSGNLQIDGGPQIVPPHLVTDMYGSLVLEPDDPFTLTQGGAVVLSDTLRGSGQFLPVGPILTTLPALVPTEFHTWRAFDLAGTPGRLDVVARMDPQQPTLDPPALEQLEIFANGEAADTIPLVSGVDAGVRFRFVNADTATLHARVRPPGQSGWTALTLEPEDDDRFLARFPMQLRGRVALRIDAKDWQGNQLELTWDPAFVATDGRVAPPPPGGARLALAGARPNPAATSGFFAAFTLPSSAPARLTLHDVTGREILRRDVGALGPGDHLVRLDPGRTLRPGLYFLRLTSAGAEVNARVCLLR